MMCDNSDNSNRQRLLSIACNPNLSKNSQPDKPNSLSPYHIGRSSIQIQVPRSSLPFTLDYTINDANKRENDSVNYGLKLESISPQQLSHQYSCNKASSEDLNGEIERYMNSLHSTLDSLDSIPPQYTYLKNSSSFGHNPSRPSAPIASQLWGQHNCENNNYDNNVLGNSTQNFAANRTASASNHTPTSPNYSSSDTEVDNEDDPPEIATTYHNLPALLPRPLHLMPSLSGSGKVFSLNKQSAVLPSLVSRSSPSEEKREFGSPEVHGAADSSSSSTSSDTIMIQQRFPNLYCRVPYGLISPMKATPLRHSLHSAFKPTRINHLYVAIAKSH